MSRMKYNYDEEGNTFYYFLFIVYGFMLISFTYYYVASYLKSLKSKSNQHQSHCECEPCMAKEKQLKSKRRPFWSRKRYVFLLVGWVAFILVGCFAWNVRNTFAQGYDPFSILGLSSGASDAEIRKQYKVLSLKFHPDRVPEAEKEQAEIRFIDISKAYKVLTDEDIKKNYEETGNPDGVKNFTLGIALPPWLVERSNIATVLSVYVMLFMILLPVMVGRWWRRSKSYTKSNIHYFSMARFYAELSDNMNMKRIIEVLCASQEFMDKIKWTPADAVLVPALLTRIKNEIEATSGEKFEKNKKFNAPYCTKTFCLLMAHLYRLPVDPTLREDQLYVIEKSFHLISGMFQIALARDWTLTTFSTIHLGQMIVQGVYDHSLPLLQLPGMTNEILKSFKSQKRYIKSTRDLMDLKEDDRRSLLSSLSDTHYKNMLLVADSIPRLVLVKPLIQVLGHKEIISASLITASFYFVLAYSDDEEKAATMIATCQDESLFHVDAKSNERKLREISGHSSPVHAPFFPIEKRPAWWALLSSTRSTNLMTQPVRMPFIESASDYLCEKENMAPDDNKPSNMSLVANNSLLYPVLTLTFAAPQAPGTYSLALDVKCDAWLGVDFRHEFKLNVVPAPPQKKPAAHEGCSCDENDDDHDSDD